MRNVQHNIPTTGKIKTFDQTMETIYNSIVRFINSLHSFIERYCTLTHI